MNTKKSEKAKIMTKQEITEFLRKTLTTVVSVNEDLAARVDYALTHLRKATKPDLEGLYSEVHLCLESLPIENQKKEEIEDEDVSVEIEEDEDTADEEEEEPEEKPKKSSKTTKAETIKKSAKTAKSAEEGKKSKKPTFRKKVEEATPMTKAMLPPAKFFPEVIEHEDLGTLKVASDKYHAYSDIVKALSDGKTLYFAVYWTKRHLKQFTYADTNLVPLPKGFAFPNDLDLLQAIVTCERIDRIWAMSLYTDAMFWFEGENLKPIEDTDPKTEEQFSIRVSNGMEFEIYEPVEEPVEE